MTAQFASHNLAHHTFSTLLVPHSPPCSSHIHHLAHPTFTTEPISPPCSSNTYLIMATADNEGRSRCMGCTRAYNEDDLLVRLPCGHTVHADEYCLQRFTPFRCMYQCPESSVHMNLDPSTLPRTYFNTGSITYRDTRKYCTPESNPYGINVQAHRNPSVAYAAGNGSPNASSDSVNVRSKAMFY